MLKDKETMENVEKILKKNGAWDVFEKGYGPVLGRMIITHAEVPEGIEVREQEGRVPQIFEASFDFYDVSIGLAMYTDTKELASELWVTPQKEDAETPAQEWIEFFIQKLLESIEEDGSYGIPICSFVNDTCDMTIVPVEEVG